METERKWLLAAAEKPFEESSAEKWEIVQGYLAFTPTVRVRSVNGETFILTVKSAPLSKDGLSREETEFPLPEETFRSLVKKCEGTLIEKTRYRVKRPDGLTEEFDYFHGALEGLRYLEVEFPSETEALSFVPPVYVGREVTADKNYTNGALARHGMPAAREE